MSEKTFNREFVITDKYSCPPEIANFFIQEGRKLGRMESLEKLREMVEDEKVKALIDKMLK